jgi:hypothetical protein
MMRKREARIRVVIPLKLVATDDRNKELTELVCTLDVSRLGLRVTSLGRALKVGSEAVLQYKYRRVAYRIIWCRSTHFSGRNYHAGLRCVDPNVNTWTLLGSMVGKVESGMDWNSPESRGCSGATPEILGQ